jgi:hypothetical protein
MKPSDNKRFCDACKKHVHDLSAMTEEDARAALATPPAEGLCVRYLYDAHGAIVFRGAPMAPSMLVRARRFAAAALPLALAACTGSMGEAPVQPMIGAVACPMPGAPEGDADTSDAAEEPPPVPLMGTPMPMPLPAAK